MFQIKEQNIVIMNNSMNMVKIDEMPDYSMTRDEALQYMLVNFPPYTRHSKQVKKISDFLLCQKLVEMMNGFHVEYRKNMNTFGITYDESLAYYLRSMIISHEDVFKINHVEYNQMVNDTFEMLKVTRHASLTINGVECKDPIDILYKVHELKDEDELRGNTAGFTLAISAYSKEMFVKKLEYCIKHSTKNPHNLLILEFVDRFINI